MDEDTTTTATEQECPDCQHPVNRHATAAGCLIKTSSGEIYTSPSGVKTAILSYCKCQNSDEALREFFAAKIDA
jgi:hypothetical protein